jgi:hypothetical protein
MKIERISTYLVEDWLLVTVATDTEIKGIGQSTTWPKTGSTPASRRSTR